MTTAPSEVRFVFMLIAPCSLGLRRLCRSVRRNAPALRNERAMGRSIDKYTTLRKNLKALR